MAVTSDNKRLVTVQAGFIYYYYLIGRQSNLTFTVITQIETYHITDNTSISLVNQHHENQFYTVILSQQCKSILYFSHITKMLVVILVIEIISIFLNKPFHVSKVYLRF